MIPPRLNFDLEVIDEKGNRTRHAYNWALAEADADQRFTRFDPDDVSLMLADQQPEGRIIGALFGFDYAEMLRRRQLRRAHARRIGQMLIDHWLDAIEKEEGWTNEG